MKAALVFLLLLSACGDPGDGISDYGETLGQILLIKPFPRFGGDVQALDDDEEEPPEDKYRCSVVFGMGELGNLLYAKSDDELYAWCRRRFEGELCHVKWIKVETAVDATITWAGCAW